LARRDDARCGPAARDQGRKPVLTLLRHCPRKRAIQCSRRVSGTSAEPHGCAAAYWIVRFRADDDGRGCCGLTQQDQPHYCVAFSKNFTKACRSSAEPILCSGILVPGVNAAGPSSNSFDTVSGVHTMSSFLSAAE